MNIGQKVPESSLAHNIDEAKASLDSVGLPAIIRPAFTLGGAGGSAAYTTDDYIVKCQIGLDASPVSQILIEKSVIGWKEFELEIMRDLKDNVVIICSIENFDPMGVHTGDSITVAPAQTLTDREYQIMRNAAIDIIREIGVETGGSNIQFAVNPDNGELVIIEMNPRVSRSSALASKATGFPIAKIAAKLAAGYTLDEITNDITKETPSCFEPAIDYCVVKTPRFAFEKFPGADNRIGTQMKSVGESMSLGRTFKESLQKAMRSLEIGSFGFEPQQCDEQTLITKLEIPSPGPALVHRRGDPAWHGDRADLQDDRGRSLVPCEYKRDHRRGRGGGKRGRQRRRSSATLKGHRFFRPASGSINRLRGRGHQDAAD